MAVAFRQMLMDVWNIEQEVLTNESALQAVGTEALKEVNLDLVTQTTIHIAKDNGYKLIFATSKGTLIIESFPSDGLLMVDCHIQDESGLVVVICEYIFCYLGGVEKLFRMSSFFERGVKKDA